MSVYRTRGYYPQIERTYDTQTMCWTSSKHIMFVKFKFCAQGEIIKG